MTDRAMLGHSADTVDSRDTRQRDPLARAIRLLTMMVDGSQNTHGVRELAGRLGVSASTAHRLLTDLERLGMVTRLPDGVYQLGLEFQRLAWLATGRYPLRDAAQPVLRELTDDSGESTFLGVYGEQQRALMFVTCVESAHPLRYVMELNKWLPLHAGASGLAILAFLPPEVRQDIVGAGLAALTSATVTDPKRLTRNLDRIRDRGYAISRGQRIPGAVAVAAPVFGLYGTVIGDVGVTMPHTRFKSGAEPALAEAVLAAAHIVTQRIGGSR